MSEKNLVFVGVEFMHATGRLRRAFVYAALDEDRKLLAIGHGDRDEILAYLGGQQSAHVAINAPRAPNTGIAARLVGEQNNLPFTTSAKNQSARLCETLLQQQDFQIDSTPDKVSACPLWKRRCFSLYKQLAGFGYAPYPSENSAYHSLETCADAIFWRLLREKQPLAPSLEGRIQRQLILQDLEMPVPDAMDFFLEVTRFKLIQGELPDQNIHTIEELNALAAAYIAWLTTHNPDKIDLIGDFDEGQIALPVKP